jgi:hypothetical protein
MKLLDRVADPTETVELTVEGRGIWLGLVLLVGACYLIVSPPQSAEPLRWLSVVLTLALVSSLMRDVRGSPFFAGPLLTLTPTEISGRGGLGQSPWRLSWDQVDHVTWGRYGLFVYRVDAAKWQQPYRQGGVGGPLLTRGLTRRLDLYRAAGAKSRAGSDGS